jgi:hypothetical protein
MKAIRHIGIFLVAALLAASCGLSKVKEIAVTSVGVAYIVPTSARSVDAKLIIGIDNPARSLAVTEMSGVIRYQDKPLAHFITGPIELQGQSAQTYELPCSVKLDDGTSILELLVIASRGSLEGLKADVDIQGALKKNGVLRKPFSFKDLDISQFKN